MNQNISPEKLSHLFTHFPTLFGVLSKLNAQNIPYLIGGSGCLFLYGNTRQPDDVDLLIPNDAHDAADTLFGITSFTYSSDQEQVRNSNPDGTHDIQLTSNLTLNLAGKEYVFDYGDESYLTQRAVTNFHDQPIFILPPEDSLIIKALLQRGKDVGKHDIEDIEAFLKIYESLDTGYLSRRIEGLHAKERIAKIFG
jgi:hypothetical protein